MFKAKLIEDARFEFQFHLDSYYMGVQIKKAMDNWMAKGIPVKRV